MSKWKYDCLKHQYQPFTPCGVETLIVGTFPTRPQNCQFEFYNSGRDNGFWSVKQRVVGVALTNSPQAVPEREDFLSQRKMGMVDIIKKCYRLRNSALDKERPFSCREH